MKKISAISLATLLTIGALSTPAAYADDGELQSPEAVSIAVAAAGSCNYSLYHGAYELRVYGVTCTNSAVVRAVMKYYLSDNTTREIVNYGSWVGTGGVSSASRPSSSFEIERVVERRG